MSRTPSPSTLPVIPPIITNNRDRQFLTSLREHIDSELAKIDQRIPEQRYIVHRYAFDKIIEHVTAYKPLLTAIKAEYEDCIETILRGKREAFYLSGKLQTIANEPITIRNYMKRSDDLEQKLTILDADNERLQQQIHELRVAREKRGKSAKTETKTPTKTVKIDNRPIPGLTLEQSTEVPILMKVLEKVERQYKEMNVSYRTRYTDKNIRENLKAILSEKVTLRDELSENTDILKEKRQKLKIAVEAATNYLRMQPPHQTIGDAVVLALARSNKETSMDKGSGEDAGMQVTPGTTFEDDDPLREKEAELMLEYIEKFNELLEDSKYEAAAIHAANSPKGILRTPETMTRFKELKGVTTGSGRSALLAFCDALMSTVLAFGVRPSEYMSMECVVCALDENRSDLLAHWISQNRLTLTEDLGHMIYNYSQHKADGDVRGCLALAQKVFMDTDTVVAAMICMIKQGRLTQALQYGRSMEAVSEDYVQLLSECPTPQLAQALYDTTTTAARCLLPLGVIATTLLSAKATPIATHFITDLHERACRDGSSSPLKQAVFSDQTTSRSQWLNIVQKCQEEGSEGPVIDLLAAITVKDAISGAAQYTQQGEPPVTDEASDKLESECDDDDDGMLADSEDS